MNSFVKIFKSTVDEEKVQYIPARNIRPNPFQPRKDFPLEQLTELAGSIKEHGIIQPLTVRKKDDFYELIAGERRLRAARLLELKKVPVIIKDCSDREMAEIALVENLQRQDLNFFEEALAYRMLLEKFELTQVELAQRVGKSQSTVANKLRLLNLNKNIQDKIVENGLSERHARALLKLKNIEEREKVLEKVIEGDLTVKETEKLIQEVNQKPQHNSEKPRIRKVFNDIRLYLNTLRKTISELQEGGIEVHVQEKEREDCFEFTIRLAKTSEKQGGK